MSAESTTLRLNKFISETGLCSRREADRLIEAGQVRVNGKVALMGAQVSDADQITVKGKRLKNKPEAVYLAYYKPVGVTSTTDQTEKDNIVDAVNYKKSRIFPVGRLDKPSEGLILLTNDGDIVNKILRAGNAHEKEYLVWVDRVIDHEFVRRMASGIPILGTVTQPCRVRQLGDRHFSIVLTQGLNRQIRRMTEYLGYQVTRLKRTRIMNLTLDGLKPGQWRLLGRSEMAAIQAMIQSSSGTEEASRQPSRSRAKSSASTSGKPVSKKLRSAKKSGKKDLSVKRVRRKA